MLVIGLTGGIAAGKTAVADRFAALGAAIIDADALSRTVVAPGSDGLQAVIDTFGRTILGEDGTLDRDRLRRHIFSDDAARDALERILHPRIRALVDQRIAATRQRDDPYCITVIPLLFETGMDSRCDRVLVVDAPEAAQIARLQARDDTDEATARSILERQSGRQQRLQRADDIIDNGDDISSDALGARVETLDREYRRLAAQA